MGVHDLWSILGPVRESVPLYSLAGKTLAVDLSLWVCEAQHVQAMMGKVTKPHLRNLFFRVSSLTLMGVKLVFVMEGEAPKLKAETMSKRTEIRFGGFKKAAPKSATTKSTNRGRFKAVLRECAEMLDYLGVPWVTAAGEAEAMCAYLDSKDLVDGCITNDGDAFLYGAQTVYRNFNMNTKDPQVDCYRTPRVQTELHLSRENLVGLAILLGCDYIPKGIPGIGKEQALRLIQTLKGQTLLQKFRHWKEENAGVPEGVAKKIPHCNVCRHPGSAKAHERGGCVMCDSRRFCAPQDFDYQCPCDWHSNEQKRQASSAEASVRKQVPVSESTKTLASEQFPFTEIINEFLISKDKPVTQFKRRNPNMLLIQNFAYDKLEWPKHYTSEKVLVLMTYTELMNRKYGREMASQIKPLRIMKPRVRNAVACFEVIWNTPDHYVFPEGQPAEDQDEVRTVEEEALFRLAYPEVVELYLRDKALAEESKAKKKKPKSKKEKSSDPCDGVSDLLAQMTLQSSTSANPNTKDTPQTLPPTNKYKPEIVDLEASVPHHGLGDDPISQDKGTISPVSRPSCGRATESEVAASPSVSAIIDALHLSDIDWEALSFTSSPPPQVATDHTSEPKLSKTPYNLAKETNAESTKQQSSTDVGQTGSKPGPDLVYTECSLRDRVLMRNTVKSLNQMETHNDVVTKKLNYESPSPEPISSHNQNPKISGQIPVKDSKGTKPLGKQHPVDRKEPLIHKDQSVTNKSDQAYHISQRLVPLSQAQGDYSNSIQKPTKYKFVKAAISLSSVPPPTCQSDPSQSEKDRKVLQTTKKSVCVTARSSSEDSDAENQQVGTQRKGKMKPKSKPKGSFLTDFRLKPISRVATTKATLNTSHEDKLIEPNTVSNSVDVQLNDSPVPTNCHNVTPTPAEDDVYIPTPSSPITIIDSDDSVICTESPLPLTERLRLRFLM
ncbi:LOW QUALITY PROTEIN: flap endonuclease GEN homolog 1 [Polymixia lowei]